MKECIAIASRKGGVGKSSTCNALGAGLYYKGYKVLYVDLDSQANLSYEMGVASCNVSSFEVLTGTATAEEAIVSTPQGDLLPASSGLASADTVVTATGKEYRLREALEPVRERYDYILLDTPASLGILTINALTACSSVIIPVQADIHSLQGIGQLSQTIDTVRKYCNRDLSIKGILLTRFNSRTVLSKDMLELLEDTAKELNTKVFKTKIRECVAIKESQASQQDIFKYNKRSNAVADYGAFIEEMLAG